jgi:hypothetical protein
MFDWLVDHGPTIELDRVHRFTHPWERQASLQLRQGDTDALALYDLHSRLHRAEPGEADFDILDHWWHLRSGGHTVAVIAANNDTVQLLNTLAQQARIDAGQLDPTGPSVTTDAGQRLLVGDEIATRRNDRHLRTDRGDMVRNRDHWRITTIGRDGDITARGAVGNVRLPPDYVAAHVDLAYAQTGHAAQGRTVDHSLLLVDTNVDNGGVYVPLTRGRHSNHAYVALDPDDPRSARDVLAEAVNRDWADTPAITRQHQLTAPGRPTAVPRAQLTLPELRHVAGQLRSIDDLNVPFHRGELPRHERAAQEADRAHRQALAARDEARAARDRTSDELQALNPWNPFAGRRRAELETLNRAANRQLAGARYLVEFTRTDFERANDRLEDRRRWLARHEPDHHQRPALADALNRDLEARALNAATSPPPRWAHRALGPRPDRHPAQAAVWDETVAAVGQYRDIWNITDDHSPLGTKPHHYNDPRRHDWQQAAASLAAAGRQLGSDRNFGHQLRCDLDLDHEQGIGISR